MGGEVWVIPGASALPHPASLRSATIPGGGYGIHTSRQAAHEPIGGAILFNTENAESLEDTEGLRGPLRVSR